MPDPSQQESADRAAAGGPSNAAIARRLTVSERTVKNHVAASPCLRRRQ